jgi:hypothetical protein
LNTRELDAEEARRLFARLAAGAGRSGQVFPAGEKKKSYSLADVYQAFGHN